MEGWAAWADPTSHDFASAIDLHAAPGGQESDLRLPVQIYPNRTEVAMPQRISAGLSAPRQLIHPKTDLDWENQRARFTELYWEQDKELDVVMSMMERERGFVAT